MSKACAPLAAHSPRLIVQRYARPLACDRVLLLHGERDTTVPISSSAMFALELTRVGQVAEFVALPGDSHTSFLLDLMVGRGCDFLVGHLKRFCGTSCQDDEYGAVVLPAARL